jgi:hypothetical protein
MGHSKNTLPYGTVGDEFDGPIPATYRLPPAPAPASPTSPAVTCPACNESWDIAELKCVAAHCDDDAFEPGPAQKRMILYWCPCGTVWAPEDKGTDGYIAWNSPQVVFDQQPNNGRELIDALRWALRNLEEIAMPLADKNDVVSSLPDAAERARTALLAAGEDPDAPCPARL